ncbi:hypothetical protein L6R52_37440 [Myxococcota bacterium]|nr:hypothetical protein [Myxococcota bacterium]
MTTSNGAETPTAPRFDRTDSFVTVGAAATCLLMGLVMVFLVPILEKALRGQSVPLAAALVIRFSKLIRANVLMPVPMGSIPFLVTVVGLVAKARGADTVGRALMFSGWALSLLGVGLVGACLLLFAT